MDETYVGGKTTGLGKQGRSVSGNKTCVVSLVERGGKSRSFVLDRITGQTLKSAIMDHVQDGSVVVTDDYFGYRGIPKIFSHKTVKHGAKEYWRKFRPVERTRAKTEIPGRHDLTLASPCHVRLGERPTATRLLSLSAG